MASSKGNFSSLDEGTKTPSVPASSTSTEVDVVKPTGAEGSVKKTVKNDGKSSIPGAVFNLANAVSNYRFFVRNIIILYISYTLLFDIFFIKVFRFLYFTKYLQSSVFF